MGIELTHGLLQLRDLEFRDADAQHAHVALRICALALPVRYAAAKARHDAVRELGVCVPCEDEHLHIDVLLVPAVDEERAEHRVDDGVDGRLDVEEQCAGDVEHDVEAQRKAPDGEAAAALREAQADDIEPSGRAAAGQSQAEGKAAQDAADEKLAEETAKRMMENKFDMNDMLDQFAQIRKMGGAGAMLSMLPGGSGIDPSQVDEKAFDRIEAMIYSMTKEEREKPSIINPKRKRRIAAGSGTRVEDVNKLLKQFEMMQKMMKQFKKSPKGFARRLGGMMGNPNAFRGLK